MNALVYSSDPERSGPCPQCGRKRHKCRCQVSTDRSKREGPVRVFRERRPGGKWIVRIEGLDLDRPSIENLARRIKKTLGTGGKVEQGNIQIQGDRRKEVLLWLDKEGIAAQPAGG